MRVAVVIPWRGGCLWRERALHWCQARYRLPVVHGYGHTPWVKAEAVMPTVERCSAEIVVLADADVWSDGVAAAIEAVDSGALWAMPHLNVHRLSKEGTVAVLGGAQWRSQHLEERPYVGCVGGGYVVARRETLLDIPLDPRFVGWGQEDECHGLAMGTLLGPPWRGDADLVHLWHPPQQRLSRTRGNKDGWLLRRRYIEARRDFERHGHTDALRALLNEANDALHSPQPALHD